jgi:hypothetical protein
LETADLDRIKNLVEDLRQCSGSLYSEKKQDELLTEIHKLSADLVINPDKIIKVIENNGYSIFHTLQAWIIDSSNVTSISVKKDLMAALPDYMQMMSVDMQDMFSDTVNVMVSTIIKVINRDCKPVECSLCILRMHCPLRCN